jgi:ATP-dependent Clp protease adaptor protein ClpS
LTPTSIPHDGHSVDPGRDRPNIRPSYIIGTAMPREKPQTGDEVLEKPKEKTKRPEMFKVVLLNDDYTTMEFVVQVLQQVFNKPEPEAYRIMMQVHIKGRGICGAYTYEIAETKVSTVHELAQENGFPLRATIEEG